MSDSKQEKWTTWVALTTALVAVLAAITTLYMGKFSSRTILAQGQETDQWAYYQAKSIKQHTFDLQKQNLELQLLTMGKQAQPVQEKFRKAIEGCEKNVKRYDKEKGEIKAKAEDLAKQKELSQRRSGNFGYALIFLQIAIMLSSISIITKRKQLWAVGMISVFIGVFFFVNGFLLFR